MVHDLERVVHLCDVSEYPGFDYHQIGCGAVGSVLALMIAKLGFKVHVQDPGIIKSHNVANQMFFGSNHVGSNKASFVHSLIQELASPELAGTVIPDIFDAGSYPLSKIVGVSVDSMEANGRAGVFRALKGAPIRFFVDTRITAHQVIVFGVITMDNLALKRYGATLFLDSDAHIDRAACGTIMGCADVATIAAAIAHRLVIQYLKYSKNPTKFRKPPFQVSLDVRDWRMLEFE